MESKTLEADSFGVMTFADPVEELPSVGVAEYTNRDQQEMAYFGKTQQLKAGSLQYCPYDLCQIST
jgi:choline transport protein